MMKWSGTVSVIIPTYNAAGTLVKAIESVLHQTYPVLEILICDDGSTDISEELVKGLDNPKVSWLDCGRNYGPGKPRNMGALAAKGDWLCFLDSDDYWLPEKLEQQLSLLADTGCQLASTNAFVSRGGIRTMERLLPSLPARVSFEELLNDNLIVCSSVMVYREIWLKTKGFPEERILSALEDYACWLQCLMRTEACIVNEPLLVYNDAPTVSIRSNGIQTIWGQRALVFGYVLERLQEQGYASDRRFRLLRKHWLRAVRKHFGYRRWLSAWLLNKKAPL
jgi:glycosyltransferase involved in cell wall biosynthesis